MTTSKDTLGIILEVHRGFSSSKPSHGHFGQLLSKLSRSLCNHYLKWRYIYICVVKALMISLNLLGDSDIFWYPKD